MRPSRALPLLLVAAWAASTEAQIYTRRNAAGTIEATNVPEASDFRLTYPGKGTLIHSRGFSSLYRGEYDRHILDAAVHQGVSPDLVRAVIQVESEYDRTAVSSKGAQGLMQLMPFTARRFGVSDSFDARQNIFGGVQYLRVLLDMFQGDIGLALAGYNAGENAVLRFGGIPPFRETQAYVQKIQGLLSGGGFRMVGAGPASPRAMSFAPSGPALLGSAPATPARVTPARPAVYYKWSDDLGRTHVAQTPPSDGVTYVMLRALN